MSAVSLSSANHQPTQNFEVRPFSAAVGAEIVGLDLSRPLNEADFARVHRAHLDHNVVVFRDTGAHITQTYARTLSPYLMAAIKTQNGV